jgi:hypothetical protein
MQRFGIGLLSELGKKKKFDSSKSSNIFKKFNYNLNEGNAKSKLMNSLMKYQVQLARYFNCFGTLKRSNSNSIMSSTKKIEKDGTEGTDEGQKMFKLNIKFIFLLCLILIF